MASFKTLYGFREFYPEDYAKRKFIFQTWQRVSRGFNFQEFDGPVLESLELFKAKSGDEIEEQLFCFTDKGGREVSLRPELTPSLARMISARANALKRPIKWFSMGDNFRYERPQKGRLRCFSQFNADILGEAGPAAEIELISLLIQTLTTFGLTDEDFYVRLSDRDLWMLYLESLGFGAEEIPGVLGVVDKWERMPEEKLLDALGKVAGDRAVELKGQVESFLAIDSIEALEAKFSEIGAGESERFAKRVSEWTAVLEGLSAMGHGAFVKMDLSIVRGLAYYTGFVFEAFDKKGEFRAIAGGGRYDALVKKMGGPDMPAVGYGMGDVVLGDLLEDRGCMPQFVETLDAYMVIGGEAERAAALEDASRLRQAGYIVDYPFKNQGFGKQFKSAIAAGARAALIYGSDELAKGVVKLRDLNTREEVEVPRAHVLDAMRDLMDG
ncbi:MAG: histidine--tRNA ligase [Verrucomicrobiota bacterium]